MGGKGSMGAGESRESLAGRGKKKSGAGPIPRSRPKNGRHFHRPKLRSTSPLFKGREDDPQTAIDPVVGLTCASSRSLCM